MDEIEERKTCKIFNKKKEKEAACVIILEGHWRYGIYSYNGDDPLRKLLPDNPCSRPISDARSAFLSNTSQTQRNAMTTLSNNRSLSPSAIETIDEIMEIYKSLPKRPTIEEVEAAQSIIKTVNTEEQINLEEISKQESPKDVPTELFSVLQGVRKTMIVFQNYQQKKEASYIIEIDRIFQIFDDLILKASSIVSGDRDYTQIEKQGNWENPVDKIDQKFTNIDYIGETKPGGEESKTIDSVKGSGVFDSSANGEVFPGGEGVGSNEKLSLMKLASLIENHAKTGKPVIDLSGKLMDQIEWLPISLGKLSNLTELDLSQNQIMALPSTLSNLKALKKLQIQGNQLINLPSSVGDLLNLTDLDLRANRLKSLPPSFINLTNLINLDLSSNHFTTLPDIIGNLTSLRILNVETNSLEELPYTMGSCISLQELRLDFNKLKALPEALGKLENLEILTLHYNRVRCLPTTMGGLLKLRELDVSFNELESIPESLCFAVRLEKLNVSNNFADLTHLPRSIGNLEMLYELDISDDQIRFLPDSFGLLSNLRVFHADETPLEVPPRETAKLGAQAVVQYMSELVDIRNLQLSSETKKGFWFWIRRMCCLVPAAPEEDA